MNRYSARHRAGGSVDVLERGVTMMPAMQDALGFGEPAIVEDAPGASVEEPAALGHAMGKGLAWSLLNNAIGRLGNFLSGIVIVRILSPDDYGTYAVGMVVLSVLLSMNELGVSVAVVQRKGSVDGIAPTVITLSIASSFVLALGAFIAAPYVSSALDAPQATGLIRLLLVGVLVDGMVAVPNALITRAFDQRKRLKIDLITFVIGTPVTIGLALAGYGAWSLGWGAVLGNVLAGTLAVAWAPARYWPGWNRDAAIELLRFGLPLAGASFVLFMMLNVDYIIVGRVLGSEQLGFYLLAFNLCSWPITVISTAIRRVSLAAFARMHENGDVGGKGFERVAGLVMALTLPICLLLAGFSHPVIDFLYGHKWNAAAGPLTYLAVLSAGRVAVELTYDYLTAVGRTRPSLWLHLIWLAAIIPALTIGAKYGGITGVGAAHAIVVIGVLLPMLVFILHRVGVSIRSTLQTMVPVIVGSVLMAATIVVLTHLITDSEIRLTVGVLTCMAVYVVAVLPMRDTAKAVWHTTG